MNHIYGLAPLPFGSLSFWAFAIQNNVRLYSSFRFEKSSFMNRIVLNNQGRPLIISLPIVGGRNSKLPLDDSIIASYGWNDDLIRGLETLYQNAPYFDYFGKEVIDFIKNFPKGSLGEFNTASIQKMIELAPPLQSVFTTPQEGISNKEVDLLSIKTLGKKNIEVDEYHNIPTNWSGEELNHLSILDLLFFDAPHLSNILRNIKFL